MEIEVKYIVNKVEFSNIEQAKKYEDYLNKSLEKAKFKEGQTVYFWDNVNKCPVISKVNKIKIRECGLFEDKVSILYRLNNLSTYKEEPMLYSSMADLIDNMIRNCQDLR